ncbi:MAG: phosphoribosylglycinamide formyltransferase [Bacteroidia bacterium]|nr:phosphoribosylglycinamide formyltransferase [Bacteroidia bacterium]
MSIRIGIFASGNGSNAINLNSHFDQHPEIEISKVYCNNPMAGVITKAFSNNIPVQVFTKRQLNNGHVLEQLKRDQIDVIVLAGFLWLVPEDLIKSFPSRIINIHPALLPHYGGKGMYGMRVHEAVVQNQEKESGITIHLVDEEYDNGDHLFQASVSLSNNETPESLAAKIHELEYQHFPVVVENYVLRPGQQ